MNEQIYGKGLSRELQFSILKRSQSSVIENFGCLSEYSSPLSNRIHSCIFEKETLITCKQGNILRRLLLVNKALNISLLSFRHFCKSFS